MSELLITLPSGQTLSIVYSYTFGEIIIGGLLIVADVLFVARWIYDVILQVWNQRKTIQVRDEK